MHSRTVPCPKCSEPLRRIPRQPLEHLRPRLRRYRCRSPACAWRGLLDPKAPGEPVAAPLPWRELLPALAVHRTVRAAAAVAGTALVGLTAWQLTRAPQPQAVLVGNNVVHRGAHLEGEHLPADHPLAARVPATALQDEPVAYVEDAQTAPPLRLRRHCAWGLPGRNPYRGSAVQALQTAQLSATVVKKIAADIAAGHKVDRVTIANDAIVAERSGRVFDSRRVALTYGMTLCVDARVNFAADHSERADLYEAMDDDGRIYAVMVPEVCGNVSVLGQRFVRDPADAGRQIPVALAMRPTAEQPQPWLRWAVEDRPRALPDALLYADALARRDAGEDAQRGGEIPEPSTLPLAGMALVVAALLWRQRRP